jgi:hypothetical protein
MTAGGETNKQQQRKSSVCGGELKKPRRVAPDPARREQAERGNDETKERKDSYG